MYRYVTADEARRTHHTFGRYSELPSQEAEVVLASALAPEAAHALSIAATSLQRPTWPRT